jgi:hypothetical protein
MKTQFIIKMQFIVFMVSSLLLINVVGLRCENKSDSLQAQSHAKLAERRVEEQYDPEAQDEKSQKYERLEWLTKQNLMKKYGRMEIQNLEESLD